MLLSLALAFAVLVTACSTPADSVAQDGEREASSIVSDKGDAASSRPPHAGNQGSDDGPESASAPEQRQDPAASAGRSSGRELVLAPEHIPSIPSQDLPVAEPEVGPQPPGERGAAAPALPTIRYAQARARRVETLLEGMSLEDKVGQMLVPGFVYHRDGSPVRSVTNGIRSELERVQPGGVLLFGANIDTVEQTRRFVEDLQAAVDPPLFIATDQEGGPVSRLSEGGRIKATEIPSARIVGAVGDPKLAYRLGAVIGRELRALGINMNLAPVADVLTNEKNSVIGNRSYGTDPHAVAEMVSATVRGIQDQGVSAVVKHFPGHGDTTGDSHSERVGTEHTLERLRAVELVPFAAGIDAGADGVMTAHIAVPKITGTTRPATLSPRMLEGVLRAEMGFDRLIISDSMSMAAITGSFGPRESAVLAVKAGVDLLLRPPKPVAAYEALLDALRRGELSRSRIDASVRRILRVKLDRGIISLSGSDARPESSYRPVTARSQGQEPDEVLGSARHERVVEDLMRRYRRRAQQ